MACLVALGACTPSDELQPKPSLEDSNYSEIDLTEQTLGITLSREVLTLSSEDGLAEVFLTVAALNDRILDDYLLRRRISLHSLKSLPERESDASAIESRDPQSLAPSTQNHDERLFLQQGGVIIEIDSSHYLSKEVVGTTLSFRPSGLQPRAKPGDLTDTYNKSEKFTWKNRTGFTISQPSTGVPPAPLDRIGVEFWFKENGWWNRWELGSFGTISAGETRTDSEFGVNRIEVVVGYETNSILFDISSF